MLRQTACQNEQWWRDASERKSKSPINRKHHGERADEHDHAVKRLQAHPAQCVADGVGVGRHAAHDVASASVVEVGEVKFVEFFEFVADETIDGVLSEAFHPHLAAVTGADTHHGEHEHHDAQSGQFVHMALGDDAVHDQSGQQRDGEGHGVVHAVRPRRPRAAGRVCSTAGSMQGCPPAGCVSDRHTYVAFLRIVCLGLGWVVVGLWCCGHSLPPRFTSVVCRASRHRHAAAGRNPCSDSQTRLILNEPYADATDAFSACRNHNKINIYTVTYHWFAGAAKTVIGAWLAGIGASHRNIAR